MLYNVIFVVRVQTLTSVCGMASTERLYADNTERVLIRRNACSTYVVKKSSVGHVPHEPSKGAVVAVPASSSTAAHGGHRNTARTTEGKQKQSLLSVHSEHVHSERDAISPLVENDVVQLSMMRIDRAADFAATSNKVAAKSSVEDYKASSSHLPHAVSGQTLQPLRLHESSSNASFSSDIVEDCSDPAKQPRVGVVFDDDRSDPGLFPGTLLNRMDAAVAKNSVTASTSENAQMLETEVISLKEQLVVQSKVCLWCEILRMIRYSLC